jgi:hypothetical protein
MQSKTRMVVASFVGVSLLLLGAVGSARVADEWFVLGA